MSRLRFCLLLAVISSCSHLGLAGLTTPEPVLIPVAALKQVTPVLPVIPDSTTAAPDTTTTTTTAKPTTTEKPTTTTTTTTTEKPTTTTEPPTTPPTTTVKPTTPTPTPTSTPAPTPGPLPPPDQGTWIWTDPKKNVTCIVVQFAAQLNVTYTKVVDNVTSLSNVILNVPSTAKVVNGNCSDDQWLQLSWSLPNATEASSMTIVYHKNSTNNEYKVKSFNISLTPDNLVNGSSSGPVELYHGAEWPTPLATSYRCKQATQLNMTSDSASVVATLTLSRLQEEAYRTSPGSGFSAARECGGGDVPDAVPIAVGCALGGLVVVVLIAYLVGRRRSAARGYLSM